MRTSSTFAAMTVGVVLLSTNWLIAAEPVVGNWLGQKPNTRPQIAETAKEDFGGWQTSDLTYDPHNRVWWSLGDQNCGERADFLRNGRSYRRRYAYQINLSQGQALAEVIPIRWNTDSEFDKVATAFEGKGTGFIDFEGITASTTPNTFFACTEGSEPWLVEMEYRKPAREMLVIRSVPISTQGNHDGAELENTSWEGIALSPDGKDLYLATEWQNSPARIYRVPIDDFRTKPRVSPKPFVKSGIKGAITGLCFITHNGSTRLAALERNAPAIFLVDFASPDLDPVKIPLDLRAPAVNGRAEGVRIRSASPEGIATDGAGKIVLIGDPAKSRNSDYDFYRAIDDGVDQTKLTKLIPLVFEIQTSAVVR